MGIEDDFTVYKTLVYMKDVTTISVTLNHPDTIEENSTYFKVTRIASRMTGTSKNFVKLCSKALGTENCLNSKLLSNSVLCVFPLTTSNALTLYGDLDENSLGLPINTYLIQNPTVDLYLIEEDYSTMSSLTGVVEIEICVFKKKMNNY